MKYETKLTLCIAGYLVGTIAVLKNPFNIPLKK